MPSTVAGCCSQDAEREPEAPAFQVDGRIAALEYSATNYFGNEGSGGAFYLAGALLIDVPPASERWLDDGPRKRSRRR